MSVLAARQLFSGDRAFFKQERYQELQHQEVASSNPPAKPFYTLELESKVWRVVKVIFGVLLFPLGIYWMIHSLIGRITVPASNSFLFGKNAVRNCRLASCGSPDWAFKRVAVHVDGYVVDAMLFGKKETLDNGRWVIASNGNGEFYEQKLGDHSFKQLLVELDANALVFNYPGVEGSSGWPSRSAMVKAYRAMLTLLEDPDKGIGAKEIVGYGHSIGGGVQADALAQHTLRSDVKYVFIKSRTFSTLASVAASLTNRLLGFLAWVFGWSFNTLDSSKKLKVPEIILQTAKVPEYTDIQSRPDLIVHDGVIPAEPSLAKGLLNSTEPYKGIKHFIGIPEGHNESLSDTRFLAGKVNELLAAQ